MLGAMLIAGGYVLLVAMLLIHDDVTFHPAGVGAVPEELAFRGYVYRSLSTCSCQECGSLVAPSRFAAA